MNKIRWSDKKNKRMGFVVLKKENILILKKCVWNIIWKKLTCFCQFLFELTELSWLQSKAEFLARRDLSWLLMSPYPSYNSSNCSIGKRFLRFLFLRDIRCSFIDNFRSFLFLSCLFFKIFIFNLKFLFYLTYLNNQIYK